MGGELRVFTLFESRCLDVLKDLDGLLDLPYRRMILNLANAYRVLETVLLLLILWNDFAKVGIIEGIQRIRLPLSLIFNLFLARSFETLLFSDFLGVLCVRNFLVVL